MKKSRYPFYIVSVLFLQITCTHSVHNTEKQIQANADTLSSEKLPIIAETDEYLFTMHQTIDTILLGDLNFDAKTDTAIVTSPIHAYPHPSHETEWGCYENNCETTVRFSMDTAILRHSDALGFWRFFATEDLNEDGMCEVAFIPNWFQSNWQGLFVYSLQNNRWQQLASASVFTSDEYDYENRVRKISATQFELVSMQWSEDGSELIDDVHVFNSVIRE